jgi:FkbM family methyltransferase
MQAGLKTFVDHRLPAAARVYRRLRDQLWYWGLEEVSVIDGLTLVAEPGLAAAVPEYNEVPTLKAVLGPRDVYVDIGAHLGLYSCIAARMNKQVVSVEPHPLNVRLLRENTRRNDLRNVEILPVAVSDSPGSAVLLGGQQGGSLVKGWGGIAANYETRVATDTLDNILAGRFDGQRLVIKVDVEGNELAVLRGARRTLVRTPAPVWMMEIGLTENFAGATNPHFQDIFDMFWSHGYRAWALSAPGRAITRQEVGRWIAAGATEHGDINYMFTREDAGAEAPAQPRQ